MNTHADKASETKSTSMANGSPKRQPNGRATVKLSGNKPEAHALMKLQELANDSPQVSRLRALQQLANDSPQVSQLRSLQALANNSPQAKQTTQLQALADATSPSPIQQKIANGIAQLAQVSEEEELIQAKPQTAQRQPNETDGKPVENKTCLPDNLKAGIESLSGLSLDHVRVHYSSAQPAQLNALAYAQGSDIHLAPGQEQHLPHEAWHIVQQAQGRVQPTMQMKDGVPVNDDAGLEREADVMGGKAVANPTQRQALQESVPLHARPQDPFETGADTRGGAADQVRGGDSLQRHALRPTPEAPALWIGRLSQAATGGGVLQRLKEAEIQTKEEKKRYKRIWDKFSQFLGLRGSHKEYAEDNFEFYLEKADSLDHLETLVNEAIEKALKRASAVPTSAAAAPPPMPSPSPSASPAASASASASASSSSAPAKQDEKKKTKEKKKPKINLASHFFAPSTTKVQEAYIADKKPNNDLIQSWITKRPQGAKVEITSIEVGKETVYIYATVTLPQEKLGIPTYKIEIHYHPVPSGNNYLHVKRSAASLPSNKVKKDCWLIPDGPATLTIADSMWNKFNPDNLSKSPWK